MATPLDNQADIALIPSPSTEAVARAPMAVTRSGPNDVWSESVNPVAQMRAECSKLRRSRGGKMSALTKTIALAKAALAAKANIRTIRQFREKIAKYVDGLEEIHDRYLDSIDDDDLYAEESTWFVSVETRVFDVFSELDDALNGAIVVQQTQSNPTPIESLSEAGIPMPIQNPIPEVIGDKTVETPKPKPDTISPDAESAETCTDMNETEAVKLEPKGPPTAHAPKKTSAVADALPLDSWIDNLSINSDSSAPASSNEAWGDTMVALNLKLEPFSGEPLKYQDFMSSFLHQVHERRTLNDTTKMTHFINNLAGPAKVAVQGLPRTGPGYHAALRLIKDTFGDPIVISRAFIDQVIIGPVIGPKDPIALRTFYYELVACWSALEHLHINEEINSSSNLLAIAGRLPAYIQNKWKRHVVDIRARGNRPGLKQMLTILKSEVLAANDAVWGSLGTRPEKPKTQSQGAAPQTNPRKTLLATNTGGPTKPWEKPCPICKALHPVWRCNEFAALSIEDRRKAVSKHRLCFNCLRPNHERNKCTSKSTCRECHERHHTLLHYATPPTEEANPGLTAPAVGATSPVKQIVTSPVMLQVVPVKLRGPRGTVSTHALLDSGSSVTLVVKSLTDRIGVFGEKTSIQFATIGGDSNRQPAQKVSFAVSGSDNEDPENILHIEDAVAIPNLRVPLSPPHSMLDLKQWKHLNDLPLATNISSREIGLLIGVNAAAAFIPTEIRRGGPNEPVAVKGMLGWSFFGVIGAPTPQAAVVNVVNIDTINNDFQQLWSTDSFGSKYNFSKPTSTEDRRSDKIISEGTFINGHYEIGLLWRDPHVKMPDNRRLAKQRLESLRRKFTRDPALFAMYSQQIESYLIKGHAKQLSQEEANTRTPKTWYLPHHGVVSPNKPGKVRVVFDAASKYEGTSLNDQLMTGPDHLKSLLGCLLRFREGKIAIMADVEGMFHQINVPPLDRDSLRFLWWEGKDISQEPKEFHMKVHIFGAASSPCCAISALKRTADDNADKFDAETARTVHRNFYVDDLLKSVNNEEDAAHLANNLISMLKRGGFRLTKWISNSKNVLRKLPQTEVSPKTLDLDLGGSIVERALGVRWDVPDDCFRFQVKDLDRPNTKRGILSLVSSMFNPDGALAPILLTPKIILQKLWSTNIDWDTELPPEHLLEWTTWKDALHCVENLTISRHYADKKIATKEPDCHVFCDASEEGIGAVAYLRYHTTTGIHCSFVVGKARCAPLKPLTIPRLELQAAVMGARLWTMIRDELDIKIANVVFWSDSKTTLAYIKNEERRFKTFVANRVAEIRDLTSPDQWRHCPRVLNPADDASRGLPPQELTADCRWLRGASFLWQDESEWPRQEPAELDEVQLLECKHEQHAAMATTIDTDHLDNYLSKTASFTKLKGVIATCQTFADKCRKECNGDGSQDARLSSLNKAERSIIKLVQGKAYSQELKDLKEKKEVSKRSHILRLSPFLDEEGILRAGGRLKNSDMSTSAKYPIIIPRTHQIATAIVNDTHISLAHSGVNAVVAEIRQQYWIPQLRSLVKQITSKCVLCKWLAAKRSHQLMANLPAARVTASFPFEKTGVDFFGPLYVKVRRSSEKRWGCIFTCMATRAVHLETTCSLDTDNFINVLRRFQSRRGYPKEIFCDNGTNFVGAEREIRESIDEWNQEQIAAHLHQKKTAWHFNPPAAPHTGGTWERLVRSVKRALRAVMKGQLVTPEVLDTVMTEVEAVLNARPLTRCSDDVNDLEPLTPNHFLLQRGQPTLPPGVFRPQEQHLRKKWRQVQALTDEIWRRWRREYLPVLLERTKWLTQQRNFTVGDLVLLAQDNTPRGHWPLAVVTKTYPGPDGHVRTVELRTKNSTLTRPVAKLCLLEGHEVKDSTP